MIHVTDGRCRTSLVDTNLRFLNELLLHQPGGWFYGKYEDAYRFLRQ